MLTITKPEPRSPEVPPSQVHDIEVLFKEARRRERRRRLRYAGATLLTLAIGAVALGIWSNAFGSPPPVSGTKTPLVATNGAVKVLACNGTSLAKPRTFIISCADANALLTDTRWSTWGTREAAGVTRFGLNLCTPYCAASPITYFPASTVHLSEPQTTPHGTFFSKLVVRYRVGARTKVFSFSWKGDPSF